MTVKRTIFKSLGVLVIAALLFAALPVGTAKAAFNEYWVAADGDCGGNSPCTANLGHALDVVAVGGTVYVEAGTYLVPSDVHVFILKEGKKLMGAGAGATILQGDGNREVISVSSDSVLDGVTITGGVGHLGNGGGMQINSGTPTIQNCAFTGNTASNTGGAIYITDGSPKIENCSFTGNTAGNSAGAIYAGGDDLLVLNSSFTGNHATNGGAIKVEPFSIATLHFNSFFGDTGTRGTEIDDSGYNAVVDARYNWWGTVAGPTVGSTSDQIWMGRNTDYSNWCLDANCDYPVYNETQGTYHQTIQGAIDAASDGDTINVSPGTFDESLELNKPNLTVQSIGGADVTILDVPDGSLTTGVIVLANMGTVTFDGFTVKDFTENGIVQGMSAHEGTIFHVLNNKIIPAADYLRNGIQVTGDGSTVIGNFVEGAYLTEDWASTAIGVVNASNVLVEDNEISGSVNGIDTGIAVYTWGDLTASNNQVINNVIYNVDYPLTVEAYAGGTTSGVDVHQNHVTNYDVPLLAEAYPDDEYGIPGVAVENVDATHNWWGSKFGPTSPVEGEATLIKWCADETCTTFLPDDNNIIEISGAINVPGGIQINVPGVTLLLKDGTVIENDSPCFVINADNTKITTESLGGAICVPTDGSNGIDVADGLTNIIIEGLEIDGSGQTTGDGIHFAGSVTDVILRDNLIHNLGGDGVEFTAAPAGTVQVKGNLFMDNTGVGVEAPSDLDVTYNAWGDAGGPATGDGISVNITSYDPWTHVDLSMESSGTDVANEVREGETITYTIIANIQKATGADFKLTFDPALVEVSGTTLGSVFTEPATGAEVVTYDNVAGEIHFAGKPSPFAEQTGTDLVLFTVTFTAKADGTTDLAFDEADFAMSPASGPSNNIYTAGLAYGCVTVHNSFSVTGTVSMQGRTVRSGISFTLTSNSGLLWGPFQSFSTDLISNNLSLSGVIQNEYQITIEQDRYLDVTTSSGLLVNVLSDMILNSIELFGGDVNNSNLISVDDASIVGANYYATGDNMGDANFDGIVNIFDLALVGGNYGLASDTAYVSWIP